MRTFSSFLCVCLVLNSPMALAAQPKPVAKFPFTARVISDRVNVRAGQSNNYESIALLDKDSELVVLDKAYSWYKVALPEVAKIFIKMDYVKLVSTEIGEITADRVNIRARPNTDASIIGQLLRGEQFFIKGNAGDKGDWLSIRPVPKTTGWVHEDLLVFKSAQVAPRTKDDPADALTRLKTEQDVAMRKRAAKFAALRPLAQGQYEVEGVLVPVVSLGSAAYKLMGGNKGEDCVAYVNGAATVIENFVGARVVVRGVAKDEPSLDAALVTVGKINLAL